MKVVRKIIKIDEELCDGCGNCVPGCAEGALQVIDGKVKVIDDKFCDGLGACLGDCPVGALTIIERETEEFDETAVEAHLQQKVQPDDSKHLHLAGCPSANIQSFKKAGFQAATDAAQAVATPESALAHWPVQIMLVPPTAPFLKGADLLVLADCVAVAYPNLHAEFLKGKAIMMGCPKFDDVQQYINKFTDICKHSGIKSITSVVMEVPCCSGLPMIVKKGMELSGAKIPMEEVVISTRGKILERKTVLADALHSNRA